MEFLKALFGDKAMTHDQLVAAIDAHNGNEANAANQIKIGNLGGGEYVSTKKHESEIERLNTLLSGKDTDIQTLKATLESLKKGNVDAETIKAKLADVETKLAESVAREAETKLKYALRDALRDAKAKDVGYLEYLIMQKLTDEGKKLELDENEHIKGWDDILSGMRTQKPDQFEKAASVQVDANPLPQPDNTKPGVTAEEFSKMGYQSRLKLKQEQPEVYNELTGKSSN